MFNQDLINESFYFCEGKKEFLKLDDLKKLEPKVDKLKDKIKKLEQKGFRVVSNTQDFKKIKGFDPAHSYYIKKISGVNCIVTVNKKRNIVGTVMVAMINQKGAKKTSLIYSSGF